MKKILILTMMTGVASCGPATFEGLRSHRVSGSENFQLLAKSGRKVFKQDFKLTYSDSVKGGIMSFDGNDMPAVVRNEVESDSRQMLKRHLGFADSQIRDLIPSKNHLVKLSKELLSVNFAQSHNGILLKDAYIEVLYFKHADGFYRLRQIDNQSFSNVTATTSADAPTLSDVERVTGRHDFTLQSSRSLIFPRNSASGEPEFLAATEFDVQGATELDGYFVTIADVSRELLEVHPKIHELTQLNAEVLERSYFYNDKMNWQIPQTSVKMGGSKSSTDIDGEIDLADAEEVVLELTSPRVRNRHKTASGGGYEITASLDSFGDGKAQVVTKEVDFRALNSYLSIHRVINHALQFVAEEEVKYFGNQIDLVFDYSGTCNAFYNSSGDSIRLYGSGGGCGAMAVVNDVIYHEWGHGYDYHTGRSGGISDGAFSEGIGDIISAYMTKSPNMGPGFKDDSETGIRNLDNNRRYPDDQGGVHFEGTIIGGTFWDLHVMLVARYGEARGSYLANHYFYRHLLSTDSYRESYKTVLALDDNDGNASTKSPNHCLINEAFAKHGLAEAENCQDEIAKIGTADQNIFFALVDDKLAVSAQSAEEVIVCVGDAPECLAHEKSDVTLVLDGQKNGRRIFLSTEKYSAKVQTVLTAITKNSRGEVIGFRSIKIAGK